MGIIVYERFLMFFTVVTYDCESVFWSEWRDLPYCLRVVFYGGGSGCESVFLVGVARFTVLFDGKVVKCRELPRL